MGRSVALIVKNEENCLRDCLASVAGIADHIVVVDTGSDDGTVAIARAFTPHVYVFPWIDDFAAARNFALEQIATDCVLFIDADDILENHEEARTLLDGFERNQDADIVGTVEIASVMGPGPDAPVSVEIAQRFFRRDRYRYEGAIHEQLVPFSGERRAAPTGLHYSHSGYRHDPASPRHKSRRNQRLLEAELAKHPDDEYYWFQLGRTHMALGRHAEAAAVFDRALASLRFDGPLAFGRQGPVSAEVLANLVVSQAYCLVNAGRIPAARDLLEAHRRIGHPGTACADFHHVLGYVYLMLGDITRSREGYEASLRYGPKSEYVRGTGGFSSHYHLGLLAEASSDLPEAWRAYARSLAAKPDYAPTLQRCVDLILERGGILPEAVRAAADPEALAAAVRDRLARCQAQGDEAAARRLLDGTVSLQSQPASLSQLLMSSPPPSP